MAGTVMDYAGTTPAAGMTTQSFRGLLEGTVDGATGERSDTASAATPEGSSYRTFVSSGLANFRLVVKQMQDEVDGVDGVDGEDGEDGAKGTSSTKQFKYICCKGPCPNAPSTAPTPAGGESGYVEMLIDIIADPYDMHDLAPTKPDIVKQLRALLPPDYASGCGALSA